MLAIYCSILLIYTLYLLNICFYVLFPLFIPFSLSLFMFPYFVLLVTIFSRFNYIKKNPCQVPEMLTSKRQKEKQI